VLGLAGTVAAVSPPAWSSSNPPLPIRGYPALTDETQNTDFR
jgi:hypothetical protein